MSCAPSASRSEEKMHEMSITRCVLDAVAREMKNHGLTRLEKVRVRVGELTAVEPESLRFCFDASVNGTPKEGASLEIEEVPLTGRCTACATEFRIEGFKSSCPECGGTSIERLTGSELDIVSIEAT